MNTKRKLTLGGVLVALIIATIALAAEGDRIIRNPNQDKDLLIQVNRGGTDVTSIDINGATGVVSFPQGASGVGGGANVVNTIENPDAEINILNWTASAGSFVRETAGAEVGFGSGSFSWDSAAASDTLTSDAVTIPNGLLGNSCQAAGIYKYETGSSGDYKIQVYDGTNVLIESDLAVTSGWRPLPNLVFTCPSSGTIAYRFTSTVDGGVLRYDNVHLGSSLSNSESSQALFVGSAQWPGTASCSWQTPSASGYQEFALDNDCPDPTVKGKATVPATKVPRLVINDVEPGEYKLVFSGRLDAGGGTGRCDFTLSDGTNQSGFSIQAEDDEGIGSIVGHFTVATAQSSLEFRLIAADDNGANPCAIFNVPTTHITEYILYKYPSESQQAVKVSSQDYFIDAKIGGVSFSLGTGDFGNIPLGTGGASSVLTPDPDSAPVGLACAGTTEATVPGDNCATNDSPGIAFNIPAAGKYLACVQFPHEMNVGASGQVETTFNMAISQNNDDTVVLIAGQNFGFSQKFSGTGSDIMTNTISLCEVFNFTSIGKKTLRLYAEQDVTNPGSVTANRIRADRLNGGVHYTVYPLFQTSGIVEIDVKDENSCNINSPVCGGVYTPTNPSGNTNIDAITTFRNSFIKIGRAVTVNGCVDIDPTAGAGTVSAFHLSVPVARSSNFADGDNDAGGNFQRGVTGGFDFGHISGAVGFNDRVRFSWSADTGTNDKYCFSFGYNLD